jgi:hypothetical protein
MGKKDVIRRSNQRAYPTSAFLRQVLRCSSVNQAIRGTRLELNCHHILQLDPSDYN